MMKKTSVVVLATAILVACGSVRRVDLRGSDASGSLDASAPSFTKEDAAATVEREAGGLTSYCPSDKCSEPYTTCPSSRFRCDVNLATDNANCGACGVVCPVVPGLGGVFQCVNGTCELKCSNATRPTADCDGIPDNGCEASLGSNDNCNACGDKCINPDKPCIFDNDTKVGECGCEQGFSYCKDGFPDKCFDLQSADDNCGSCGKVCTDGPAAGPPPPHSHYGCAQGECGHLKCDAGYADCDGDLGAPNSDGCETFLRSTTDCGACDAACDPGQTCAVDSTTKVPRCMCNPGERNCGTAASPACVDIDADPFNCGGCGIQCNLYYLTGAADGILSHWVATCTSGSCGFACEDGWADCNGRIDDGCEVNTNSDPGNCGGCGKPCDAVAGQACVNGQCAVEPCVDDEGPTK